MLKRRFEELDKEHLAVMATAHPSSVLGMTLTYVDNHLFEKWCTKVRVLFKQLASAGFPEYLESFEKESKPKMVGVTNHGLMRDLSAIFLAAKEDAEGGWLVPLAALVRAEVFDDELEQAEELRSKGYAVPAAVIARTVLETALRNLCIQNGVAAGMIGKMNEELKKATVYDALVYKRIVALSAVGNAAAHGDAQFNPADVEGMLVEIRRFLQEHKP